MSKARITTLVVFVLSVVAVGFVMWSLDQGWSPSLTLEDAADGRCGDSGGNGAEARSVEIEDEEDRDGYAESPDGEIDENTSGDDGGEGLEEHPEEHPTEEPTKSREDIISELNETLSIDRSHTGDRRYADNLKAREFERTVSTDTAYGDVVLETYMSGPDLDKEAMMRLKYTLLEFAAVSPQSIVHLFDLALNSETQEERQQRALYALKRVALRTDERVKAYLKGVDRASELDPDTAYEDVVSACVWRLVRHRVFRGERIAQAVEAALETFESIVDRMDRDARTTEAAYRRATTIGAATAIRDPYMARMRPRLGLACAVVAAVDADYRLHEFFSDYLWPLTRTERGVPGARITEFPKGTHLELAGPKTTIDELFVQSVVAACARGGVPDVLVNYLLDDRAAWQRFAEEKMSMTPGDAREYAKGREIRLFRWLKWPRDHSIALAFVDHLEWLSDAEIQTLVSVYKSAVGERSNWRGDRPLPELQGDVSEFTQRCRTQPDVPEWLLQALDELESSLN